MKLRNKILAGEERIVKRFAYLPTILTIDGNKRELVWMKSYWRRYLYGTAYEWKIHEDSLTPLN